MASKKQLLQFHYVIIMAENAADIKKLSKSVEVQDFLSICMTLRINAYEAASRVVANLGMDLEPEDDAKKFDA